MGLWCRLFKLTPYLSILQSLIHLTNPDLPYPAAAPIGVYIQPLTGTNQPASGRAIVLAHFSGILPIRFA